MLVVLTVRAPFAFTGPVAAHFAEDMQLSLDCAICRKKQRTVVMAPGARFSHCTPTPHAFPARVVTQR